MGRSALVRAARVVTLTMSLVACQTMSDVRPGEGRSITITGRPYDQVWDATLKVAAQHFTIHEQSKTEGIIFGERSGMGGGWIGIYFTAAGASTFRVEVVRKGKYVGQVSWTDWEKRVLGEVQTALGVTPAR